MPFSSRFMIAQIFSRTRKANDTFVSRLKIRKTVAEMRGYILRTYIYCMCMYNMYIYIRGYNTYYTLIQKINRAVPTAKGRKEGSPRNRMIGFVVWNEDLQSDNLSVSGWFTLVIDDSFISICYSCVNQIFSSVCSYCLYNIYILYMYDIVVFRANKLKHL